ASRVRSELDRATSEVVLVGHSYGGAVITEAGDHPAVGHLVYLCAFALDAGESCGNAAADAAASISHEGRPDLGAGFLMGADDTVTLDHDTAATCFYHDCDADAAAWAMARLGPHPLITIRQ